MVAKPRAIRDMESIVMGSGDAENPRAVGLRLEVSHPALLIPLDSRDSGAKSLKRLLDIIMGGAPRRGVFGPTYSSFQIDMV